MTPAEKINRLALLGNTAQLIDYVGFNAKLFNSLINTYIRGPYRITQRVAGPLTQIAIQKPALLKPHFKRLTTALAAPDASTAIKRNTIRMFQFVPIPAGRQGQIIDIAFHLLQGKRETIAVKVFAMTVLENLSVNSPELGQELRIILEDQLPYAGPAFRSRASKILKRLSQARVR